MMRYAVTTKELSFFGLSALYRWHKWPNTNFYLYRISTDHEYEFDALAAQPGFGLWLPGLNTPAFKKDGVTSNLPNAVQNELQRVGITPTVGDSLLDLMRAWRAALGGAATDFDISA